MKFKVIFASMFIFFVSFASVFCNQNYASADQIAVTSDGKKVKLFQNGTYSYLEEKKYEYEEISFKDYLTFTDDLLGKKITINGNALLRGMRKSDTYCEECGPHGSIYGEKFKDKIVQPSVYFCIPKMTKPEKTYFYENLKKTIPITVSGVLKKSILGSDYIEVHSYEFIDQP